MNEERIPKEVSNMKVKVKCPRGRSTSRWEQHVMNNEGRPWEETEEKEELWGDRDRWTGLIVRTPTYSRNISGRRIDLKRAHLLLLYEIPSFSSASPSGFGSGVAPQDISTKKNFFAFVLLGKSTTTPPKNPALMACEVTSSIWSLFSG
jgi:hypothetical protein